jgi:IstB-like ATP binding protein
VCACQQGRRVRFTTLAALANELQEADSRRELGRVIGRYTRVELLVLDELGYLACPTAPPSSSSKSSQNATNEPASSAPLTCPSGNGPRCSPTPHSPRPSLTGSPTRHTSSTPAPRAGASATDWTARDANEHDPRPPDAHATIAAKPFALRARPSQTTVASCRVTGRSGNINQAQHRREVGPLQAVAPGPVQVVGLSAGFNGLGRHPVTLL